MLLFFGGCDWFDPPPASVAPGVHIVTWAPDLKWLPAEGRTVAEAETNAMAARDASIGSTPATELTTTAIAECGGTVLEIDPTDPVALALFPAGNSCLPLFTKGTLGDLGLDITTRPSACPTNVPCFSAKGEPLHNVVMGVEKWRANPKSPYAPGTVVIIDTALRTDVDGKVSEPFFTELVAWSCVTRDMCAGKTGCTNTRICDCGGGCPDGPTGVTGGTLTPVHAKSGEEWAWGHGVLVGANASGSSNECDALGVANGTGIWFASVYSFDKDYLPQGSFWDVWKVLKQVRRSVKDGNPHKVAVVNLSSNAYGVSVGKELRLAFDGVTQALWEAGVPVVVSGGNSTMGTPGKEPVWPADARWVIPVTGIREWATTTAPTHDGNTRLGMKDGFGNPWLAAPSDDDLSPVFTFSPPTLDCTQGASSGAAAFVSGLIAELRAAYPSDTAEELVKRLRSTAPISVTYGSNTFTVQPATLP